jgi:hypothetical protein
MIDTTEEVIVFRGSVSDLATDVAWVLRDRGDHIESFVEQLRAKMPAQDSRSPMSPEDCIAYADSIEERRQEAMRLSAEHIEFT